MKYVASARHCKMQYKGCRPAYLATFATQAAALITLKRAAHGQRVLCQCARNAYGGCACFVTGMSGMPEGYGRLGEHCAAWCEACKERISVRALRRAQHKNLQRYHLPKGESGRAGGNCLRAQVMGGGCQGACEGSDTGTVTNTAHAKRATRNLAMKILRILTT